MALSDGGHLLRIGEVAERVGLSLRTIRYYEEVGLLTPASRSGGGFRLYSEEDVRKLTVLKGVKPLGLSLEEARRLMKMLIWTEDREALAHDDLAEAVTELETICALADARIALREQHLEEAKQLQRRIAARLEECRGALARRATQSVVDDAAAGRTPER